MSMPNIWDGVSLERPSYNSMESLSSAASDTASSVSSMLSEGLATDTIGSPAMPSAVVVPQVKKHQKYTGCASVKIIVSDGPDLLEYDLPRQPFLHHSSFFRQLFAQLPGSLLPGRFAALEGAESTYFLDVTPAEFDSFLTVLYPDNYATLDLTVASEWTAVLKLATLWHMSSIRELAISRLIDLLLDQPVERLVVARTYDIEQWVDSARLALCTRAEPLCAEEIARLAPMDVAFIAEGRVAHAVSVMRADLASGQSQQQPNFGIPPDQLKLLRANPILPQFQQIIKGLFERVSAFGSEDLFMMIHQLRSLLGDLQIRGTDLQNQADAGADLPGIARQNEELGQRMQVLGTLHNKTKLEVAARRDKGQLPPQTITMIQSLVNVSFAPPPPTLPNGLKTPWWIVTHGAGDDLFWNPSSTQQNVEEAVARIRARVQAQMQNQTGNPAAQGKAQAQLQQLQHLSDLRVVVMQHAPSWTPKFAHFTRVQASDTMAPRQPANEELFRELWPSWVKDNGLPFKLVGILPPETLADRPPIPLQRLHAAVWRLGGHDAVGNRWALLGGRLGWGFCMPPQGELEMLAPPIAADRLKQVHATHLKDFDAYYVNAVRQSTLAEKNAMVTVATTTTPPGDETAKADSNAAAAADEATAMKVVAAAYAKAAGKEDEAVNGKRFAQRKKEREDRAAERKHAREEAARVEEEAIRQEEEEEDALYAKGQEKKGKRRAKAEDERMEREGTAVREAGEKKAEFLRKVAAAREKRITKEREIEEKRVIEEERLAKDKAAEDERLAQEMLERERVQAARAEADKTVNKTPVVSWDSDSDDMYY